MRLTTFLSAIVTAAAISTQALADWSPSGPIKLQIGFGAGGETDTMGRAIAAAMERQTGWDVIA